jgi:hypothetical protein
VEGIVVRERDLCSPRIDDLGEGDRRARGQTAVLEPYARGLSEEIEFHG